MANVGSLDWGNYFHTLSDDDIRELAGWLAAEYLELWEFMDIVDRAYIQATDAWHGQVPAFVSCCGRPAVTRYARRKQHFAELAITLDEARVRGALPGEVEAEELQPLRAPKISHQTMEDLLGVLERARGGPR